MLERGLLSQIRDTDADFDDPNDGFTFVTSGAGPPADSGLSIETLQRDSTFPSKVSGSGEIILCKFYVELLDLPGFVLYTGVSTVGRSVRFYHFRVGREGDPALAMR
jgi:hypothetical protein